MTKFALYGAILGVISLSAQDTVTVQKKLDIEKNMAEVQARAGELKIMGASMINGPTVKGAPYSAQAINEMVQTLGDGNHITNTSSSMVYRDSQGRERREESSGGALRSVVISDPVDGVSFMLEPNSKVARKTSQQTVSIVSDRRGAGDGVGVGRGGANTVIRNFSMSTGNGPETFVFTNQELRGSKADTKVEHLGTQTIEGVSAEGTRTTITIPAGQIGNERPIETVSERWYSPDLQVTVMSTRSDPRTGTTTFKLTNISRAEPVSTLFQVPADYTVHDMTSGSKGYSVKPDEQ